MRLGSAAQVILCAAAERRFVEAKHAPADGVAISAVAGRAVVALHGVLPDQFEERVILFLYRNRDLELLRRRHIGEGETGVLPTDGVKLIETVAIGVLMTAIVAGELAIDVVDYARLRSTGELVGRDYLIAE